MLLNDRLVDPEEVLFTWGSAVLNPWRTSLPWLGYLTISAGSGCARRHQSWRGMTGALTYFRVWASARRKMARGMKAQEEEACRLPVLQPRCGRCSSSSNSRRDKRARWAGCWRESEQVGSVCRACCFSLATVTWILPG